MNTSVTNRATISVGTNVSAGTYFETITATDTLGAETSTVIAITVNGSPTVSGATNLVTTFGVAFTSPVFTAVSGNGTYTFTLVSNPINAGITLSSSINGQARVSVGSTVTAGTYNETLTVTDGLGATGRMNFTIKVNAPVALSGTQTINATYVKHLQLDLIRAVEQAHLFSVQQTSVLSHARLMWVMEIMERLMEPPIPLIKFAEMAHVTGLHHSVLKQRACLLSVVAAQVEPVLAVAVAQVDINMLHHKLSFQIRPIQ
jgi:hypothetical protein